MSDRTKELQDSVAFQQLPEATQGWILASPNATTDFADFFAKGGAIQTRQDLPKPFYSPTDPPYIAVDQRTWEGFKTAESTWGERQFFGMLAHEVGHDRINTGSVRFTGKTAEDYVQHRSGIEAGAIFNAFPIFKDLEKHPDFAQNMPFDKIGYLSGFELKQIYNEWDVGKLTDDASIKRIASHVASHTYTLGNDVQDMNNDGTVTHRDKYLQDYERLVAPKQKPQAGIDEPSTPLERSLRDGVVSLDKQANKQWDESSDRLYAGLLRTAKEHGFGPDDQVQVSFNKQTERYGAGELIHLARAGPYASADPAQNRAHASTAELLATPAAVNLDKAQSIPFIEQAQVMQRGLTPDDPARSGPVMRA